MTISVFLASMTAIAIAAMLILALTSGRWSDDETHNTVDVRSDDRKHRRF